LAGKQRPAGGVQGRGGEKEKTKKQSLKTIRHLGGSVTFPSKKSSPKGTKGGKTETGGLTSEGGKGEEERLYKNPTGLVRKTGGWPTLPGW